MQKQRNRKYKTDLKKRCYRLSLGLIKLINSFPNKRAYWIIGDQLLRSGTSIGANLVEARGASSKRDFKRFHEIALKSSNETLYWLELLRDSELVEQIEIEPHLEETKEITKMIAAGVLKMKGKRT